MIVKPIYLQHEIGEQDQKNSDISNEVVPIVFMHVVNNPIYLK